MCIGILLMATLLCVHPALTGHLRFGQGLRKYPQYSIVPGQSMEINVMLDTDQAPTIFSVTKDGVDVNRDNWKVESSAEFIFLNLTRVQPGDWILGIGNLARDVLDFPFKLRNNSKYISSKFSQNADADAHKSFHSLGRFHQLNKNHLTLGATIGLLFLIGVALVLKLDRRNAIMTANEAFSSIQRGSDVDTGEEYRSSSVLSHFGQNESFAESRRHAVHDGVRSKTRFSEVDPYSPRYQSGEEYCTSSVSYSGQNEAITERQRYGVHEWFNPKSRMSAVDPSSKYQTGAPDVIRKNPFISSRGKKASYKSITGAEYYEEYDSGDEEDSSKFSEHIGSIELKIAQQAPLYLPP